MRDRATRLLLVLIALLLAALLLEPVVERVAGPAPAPRAVEARGSLSEFERSSTAVFASASPSVVQVVGISPGRSGENVQSGTGFVWDGVGHVVTNNHVVEGAQALSVRLASGKVLRADVVGRTPNYDLAVLRLRNPGPLPPPLPIGESASLRVGQVAFAIGNPFALDQSMTMGIISALRRRLPTSNGREIANVIQTDAAINPGNSGGPLLDSAGRLIGVNTAIYSPSGANAGIGFSIPVDVVNRVVPALIKDGRVPTPGIGIVAADETATARLGIAGIVIADVLPGTPAEKAGLTGIDRESGTIGDVIVEVDGKPAHQLTDLTSALESIGLGGQVRLGVMNGERVRQVTVAIADIGENASGPRP